MIASPGREAAKSPGPPHSLGGRDRRRSLPVAPSSLGSESRGKRRKGASRSASGAPIPMERDPGIIFSMTGFGQACASKKRERFTLTLKSVNHRYFETQFHLPLGLDYLESFIRSKVQQKIKRGRINVSISHINESPELAVFNEKLAARYYHLLEEMRRKLKLSDGIGAASLVAMPGVLSHRRQELKVVEREALIKAALERALKNMVAMRRREGAALAGDLARRLGRILGHMDSIKKLVENTVEENKKIMSPEHLEGFLRSTDVGEEITRIDFHLTSFRRHMKVREPKGKVLDFIAQELQREINTLGAKVQDKHVAYQVVMVKDQIEKIREQVQNVE